MDAKGFVIKRTLLIALGQLICIAVMIGVFVLLGFFDYTVLLGGLAGGLVATLNFLFMAIGLSLASDKAQNQDAKGGKLLVNGSYFVRILVMFAVLYGCAKSGHFHVVALVLPLLFVRPILTLTEFFSKKGGDA